MKLRDYLQARRGRPSELAARLGVTTVFVRNAANGHRNVGPEIALAIERETAGLVTVAELRPDLAESLAKSGYVREAALKESA